MFFPSLCFSTFHYVFFFILLLSFPTSFITNFASVYRCWLFSNTYFYCLLYMAYLSSLPFPSLCFSIFHYVFPIVILFFIFFQFPSYNYLLFLVHFLSFRIIFYFRSIVQQHLSFLVLILCCYVNWVYLHSFFFLLINYPFSYITS